MELVRILIALGNENQSISMKNLLVENEFSVIDISKDGHDCLRKARALRPDLVIMDFDLITCTGYEVARVLCEDKICSTILIVNENQKSLINEHWDKEGFVCLIKPISRATLITTIELIVKNNRRIRSLEKEIDELRDSLETRKLVEKAKGILMHKYGISEQEAFRQIQQQSMNRGTSMKEISNSIINKK